MLAIYKYPIDFGQHRISMPRGAHPLHFGLQGNGMMLWAEVETTAPHERLRGGGGTSTKRIIFAFLQTGLTPIRTNFSSGPYSTRWHP